MSEAAPSSAASAAPSNTGTTGGGGSNAGGGGNRRDTLITIFKSASFAFFFGGFSSMFGGYWIILTALAAIVFYIRLIYWAIPADLPGRNIKVEFIIDICCAVCCLIDIGLSILVLGGHAFLITLWASSFLAVSLCVLSFLEFKKWKSS